jgi:hypothetical protein
VATFLSDTFQQTNWTDQEIGYAMKRAILVVPVKVSIVPYGFMGRYQALVQGPRSVGSDPRPPRQEDELASGFRAFDGPT